MTQSHFIRHLLCLLALAVLASCSPKNPRAELQAAKKLMAEGKFAEALPHTVTCLDIEADSIDAIIAHAICVYNSPQADDKQRKNARLNLQRATSSLAPENFDAWYVLTWALFQERDYDQAISAVRNARGLYRSLQTNPTIPKNPACDSHDFTLAQANPKYANLLAMYADICRQNRLDEGINFYATVLRLTKLPHHSDTLAAFADLHFALGNQYEAFRLLKYLSEKEPDNLLAVFNYAVVDEQRRLGNLTPRQRQSLRTKYERALALAQEQNNDDIVKRTQSILLRLR